MKVITSGSQLREIIEINLATAKKVVIISAYVTKPAVDWLLTKIGSGIELVVVGRFSPRDFLSGSSDLESIQNLLKHGAQVKLLENLHAKVTLFDDHAIIIGSANFTSRGYGIAQTSNIEASVFLDQVSDNDIGWICDIERSAIPINFDLIDTFKFFLLDKLDNKLNLTTDYWPYDTIYHEDLLFVHNFPLSAPLGDSGLYDLNPNADFKIIHQIKEFDLARSLFINSKAFRWLITKIDQSESASGLSFGEVSSLLHDSLYDDPRPYRKTVKELQYNLYKYVELYASDLVEVYRPGERSDFIRRPIAN